MSKKITFYFYNGDWHKQKPLSFSECLNMRIDDLYNIFQSKNYRKNTGTFLMNDAFRKNISGCPIAPYELDKLKHAKCVVTNAFHCMSPKYVFVRDYWQKILDTGVKVVPMTCGFRYHEKGRIHLSRDMVYILKQISERNEIAVRGEIAASVLERYGISNVRVVGCHSLFYHMDRNFEVHTDEKQIERINFNFNQCYSDFYQTHKDFCRLSMPIFIYILKLYENKSVAVDYTLQTAFMKELISYDNFIGFNRVRSFLEDTGRYFFSVDDWIGGLKKDQFSIGTQFHGNVAAILAGVPALIIAIDNRMIELCEYHRIPYICPEKFNAKLPINAYYEFTDYSKFNKYYKYAYDNFLEYCHKNDVDLIKH